MFSTRNRDDVAHSGTSPMQRRTSDVAANVPEQAVAVTARISKTAASNVG